MVGSLYSPQATSGSSYQQYTIKDVKAKLNTYTYASAPAEPWPSVVYSIVLVCDQLEPTPSLCYPLSLARCGF